MYCEICKFKIGVNYLLENDSSCEYCQTTVHTAGLVGTYEGLKNGLHIFRVHPTLTCSGCGEKLTHLFVPCSDDGGLIDVTEEFKKLPTKIRK
ncbi:MAG: hypothetical protein HYV90_05380 [Candidatus Woesebacteria bacterium]|nr:MAG: hypothetical protein HYV90_05380 [Candidatus Woesebacteria bacterium]